MIPSLEKVAWEEIRRQLVGASWVASTVGLVLFRCHGDLSALLRLRTTEDVFAVVDFSHDRAVLLTSQHDLVRRGLAEHPELRRVREVPVRVLGQPARIYVLSR